MKNENKETVSWYQEEEKGAKNQYHRHRHTQNLLFSSKYLYSSQTQYALSLKKNPYGVQGSGGSSVLVVAEMLDSTETSASSSSSSSIVANSPLISALVAFAIAQSIKVFTTWYRERRWDLKQLFASGGMPSSHSATVAALSTSIGLQEGVGGSAFAVSLILTCIVMYDATGVRLQAGRQAEVLNQIVYELPAEHPLSESGPLRELLGHTPPQVIAGGLLGIVAAVIGHVIALFT